MSRFDDDFEGPDESEDTDPTIRELRAEIIRLEAQLDQLTASVREQAAESALIQAKLVELEARIVRLEARRRRDEKLIVLAWVIGVLSLALALYTYLAQ
jgi:septal ring factor EnvC (AmiA/AmiB activator)